jgi:hypothetical protein
MKTWVTTGLAVAMAVWAVSSPGASANDRRVRDRREDARDKLRDLTPEQREKGRENAVDKHEANQAKRIEHGIKNGSLTPDELAKLESQQAAIKAMEAKFEGDGKLTRSEFKELQEALNVASRCIFAEKHDTEGFQMPVYRLGRNVRLNPDVAQKLADDNLGKADARAFAKDFHRMLWAKHQLATDKDLSADQRAKLQAEYNDLLNKYFYLVEETTTKK